MNSGLKDYTRGMGNDQPRVRKALETVAFQPVPEDIGEQKVKTQDIRPLASEWPSPVTHTEGVVGKGLAW